MLKSTHADSTIWHFQSAGWKRKRCVRPRTKKLAGREKSLGRSTTIISVTQQRATQARFRHGLDFIGPYYSADHRRKPIRRAHYAFHDLGFLKVDRTTLLSDCVHVGSVDSER
jgi:hypothetical protein